MKHHTPRNKRMKMEEDELCKSRSHVMRENDDDVALLMHFHSRSIYESVVYVNAMRSDALVSSKESQNPIATIPLLYPHIHLLFGWLVEQNPLEYKETRSITSRQRQGLKS